MAAPTVSTRSSAVTYQPALAWFAALGSLWVFVLVTLGAFTTSIGAGMAFPDWPLSNGSINPEGWLDDIAMFAEHSHRLSGMTMGLLTIGLAVWLWQREPRAWLRQLGWWSLGIVVVQGLLGGQRVTLDAIDVPWFHMSLGQILRIPHGVLAQVFVCVLFAIAAGLSRSWITRPPGARPLGPRVRQLGVLATTLVFVQLIVAAVMRHNHAGLAIPTFPLTPEGGLIPSAWNFGVAIHFAHRAMALVLTVVLPWFAAVLLRDPGATRGLRQAAYGLVVVLTLQLALGAGSVWSTRNPYMTTAHVIVGACLLAVTFTLTWWTQRDVLENRPVRPALPRAGGRAVDAPLARA